MVDNYFDEIPDTEEEHPPALPDDENEELNALDGARIRKLSYLTSLFFAFFVVLPIGILAYQSFITRKNETTCVRNMRLLEERLNAYAEEHDGYFPELLVEHQFSLFMTDVLQKGDDKYIVCPEDRRSRGVCLINYTYPAYKVTNLQEGKRLLSAFKKIDAKDKPKSLMASHKEMEPFEALHVSMRNDPVMAEKIPLLIERTAYHGEEAIHVLFLNGAIERIEMETKFPAQYTFIDKFPDMHLVFDPSVLKGR